MAQILKVNNSYWTVGEGNALQQINPQDFALRYNRTPEQMKVDGTLVELSPDQVQLEYLAPRGDRPQGAYQIKGLELGGAAPYIYNEATLGALGLNKNVAPNVQSGGQIQQDTDLAQMLADTRKGLPASNPPTQSLAQIGSGSSNSGQQGQVYRDQNDNFFFNGQPIDLKKFKELQINADFVPRGSTTSLQQAVSGQGQAPSIPSRDEQVNNLKALGLSDATIGALGEQGVAQFAALGEAIKSMYEQNNPVPQTFTDSDLERIFKQASEDPNINEYYKNQLRIGNEELRRNLAYVQGDWQALEKQQQNKLMDEQKSQAELYAEKGTINSGFYAQAQKRLQEENRGVIESSKRTLQKEIDRLGMGQEKSYGSQNLQPISVGGISYNPVTGISGQLEQNRLLDIRGKEEELINKESLTRGLTT